MVGQANSADAHGQAGETPMTHHPGVLAVDRPLDDLESSRIINALDTSQWREATHTGDLAEAPMRPGGGEGRLGDPVRVVHARSFGLKAQLRSMLLASAGLLAIASAGYFGWHYWTAGRFQVSTDNAYVKADNITIAPKVSGYIASVLVGDNEAVHA